MLTCLILLSIALFCSCSLNWYILRPAKSPVETGPTKEQLNTQISNLKDELARIEDKRSHDVHNAKTAEIFAKEKADRLEKQLSIINGQVEEEANKRTSIVLARFQQDVEKAAAVKLEAWRLKEEKAIREDAIKRSQSVITGKVTEHILPYLEGFDFNPKDCRFIGSPLDFLVFHGLSEKEYIDELVFVEIKTGKTPALTDREKAVRDAVMNKRVRWQIIHKTQ